MSRSRLICSAVAGLLLIPGCGGDDNRAEGERPRAAEVTLSASGLSVHSRAWIEGNRECRRVRARAGSTSDESRFCTPRETGTALELVRRAGRPGAILLATHARACRPVKVERHAVLAACAQGDLTVAAIEMPATDRPVRVEGVPRVTRIDLSRHRCDPGLPLCVISLGK
jgi:hypothetical protein